MVDVATLDSNVVFVQLLVVGLNDCHWKFHPGVPEAGVAVNAPFCPAQ
jgi:hypothetical protein